MWIPLTIGRITRRKVEIIWENQRTTGRWSARDGFDRRAQAWLLAERAHEARHVSRRRFAAEFDGLVWRLGGQYPEAMAKDAIPIVPTRDVAHQSGIRQNHRTRGDCCSWPGRRVGAIVACANLANS
jgi:hypothetical protein